MKKIFLGVLLCLTLLPSATLAASFEASDNVYLEEATPDDLYAAGQSVRVRNDVNGDAFLAGNQVILDGTVTGDVYAAGQNVDLSGAIEDDLKAAGTLVNMAATVKDDAFLAGTNLSLSDESSVGGDLLFAGASIEINGPVEGNVKGTGDTIYLNSEIKGDVTFYDAGKITLGPKAKINGNLTYSSLNKLEIPEGVVGKEVIFKERTTSAEVSEKGILAGFSFFNLLTMLFVGLLLLGFAKHFPLYNNNKVFESPFKTLGVGALVLITTPILAVIFMVTMVGLPLGLILLPLWLIALYVAKISAALLIGKAIVKCDEKSGFLRLFGGFALGTLVYVVLGLIPFIGWALKLVVLLMALGGLFLGQMDRFSEMRKKKLV